MNSTDPGNRQASTMPTAGAEVMYTKPKFLLGQAKRQALSSVNSNACSGSVRSEKQSTSNWRASPKKAISTDGAKLLSAGKHCTTELSCLSELPAEVVMADGIIQSSEKAGADLSMEATHLGLDCSDDLYLLSEGESLAVADDAPEEDELLSLIRPSIEDKADGLPAWPELESRGPQCSTPDWLELLPELAIPDLEEEGADSADFSDIEAMHLCSDDEHLYDLPEEFRLDDKLFDVLRGVRSVGFLQKRDVAADMSLTPPEFALPTALEGGYVDEAFLDVDALDKPIPEDELQYIPLE